MKKKQHKGFTLVELLVSMVMFVLVIAAASQVFTSMVSQFKEQGKIQETQIEGLIGLELLRYDIEHAGYGLPWNMGSTQYNEAEVEGKTLWIEREFNDGPPAGDSGNNPRQTDLTAGTSLAPGAIRSEDGDGIVIDSTFNESDVLVVKSMNVARNEVAQRWTRLGKVKMPDHPQGEKRNGLSGDDFDDTDRVVVIIPGNTNETRRTLMASNADNTTIFTAYNNTRDFAPGVIDDDVFIIYGIMPQDTFEPRMPFNRADFYIRKPANMPIKCVQHLTDVNKGTGILYKGQISQNNGEIPVELPLLDCVADMQVVYRIDDGAGPDEFENSSYVNTLTAGQIREQVREVRVYILAQVGQRSGGYRYDNFNCPNGGNCILVGEEEDVADTPPFNCDGNTYCGREFDLDAQIGDDADGNPAWEYHRWKLYTLVVTPKNLRR